MQHLAGRLVFVFCVDWVLEVKVLLERQRVPPSVALVAYHLLKWLERNFVRRSIGNLSDRNIPLIEATRHS